MDKLTFIPLLLIAVLVFCYLVVFTGIIWVCLLLHPIVAIIVGAIIIAITAGGLLVWYALANDW